MSTRSKSSRTARSSRAATPTTPTHSLTLSETQAAFVADRTKHLGYVGGIGAGKTYAGAARALLGGFLNRSGAVGIVIAPTYPMLRDGAWTTALELWQPLIARVSRQDMEIELVTGARVLFRSADQPDRIRGINAHWIWVDEAAMCDPSTWDIALGRLRQFGEEGFAWITTTPRGRNWVYETFVEQPATQAQLNETLPAAERVAVNTKIYRASSLKNPFLPEGYVRDLKARYSSQFALQELEGEFVTLGGGLIKTHWFSQVDWADVPPGLSWVRYWDLAASEKTTADYTASFRVALAGDTLYIADGIRGRWAWPDAKRRILATMAAEEDVTVGIEAIGMQLALGQDLMSEPITLERVVKPVVLKGDKIVKASPWIARAEQGKVKLVRGPWVGDFLDECAIFPTEGSGIHDDQIDSISGGVAMLASSHSAATVVGVIHHPGPLGRPRRAAPVDPRGAEPTPAEASVRATETAKQAAVKSRLQPYVGVTVRRIL